MKASKSIYTIKRILSEIVPKVHFQDWQREEVWKLENKRKLIETIMSGHGSISELSFGIPTDGKYKGKMIVIDGRQRLRAITDFVRNPDETNSPAFPYKEFFFKDYENEQKQEFMDFEVSINVTRLSTEAELKEDYLARQLGKKLTVADKLRAIDSNLTTFIEEELVPHPLFKDSFIFKKMGHGLFLVMASYVFNSLYRREGQEAQDSETSELMSGGFSRNSRMLKIYKNVDMNTMPFDKMKDNLDFFMEQVSLEYFKDLRLTSLITLLLLFNEFALSKKHNKKAMKDFYLTFAEELKDPDKHKAFKVLFLQGQDKIHILIKRLEYIKMVYKSFMEKAGVDFEVPEIK